MAEYGSTVSVVSISFFTIDFELSHLLLLVTGLCIISRTRFEHFLAYISDCTHLMQEAIPELSLGDHTNLDLEFHSSHTSVRHVNAHPVWSPF